MTLWLKKKEVIPHQCQSMFMYRFPIPHLKSVACILSHIYLFGRWTLMPFDERMPLPFWSFCWGNWTDFDRFRRLRVLPCFPVCHPRSKLRAVWSSGFPLKSKEKLSGVTRWAFIIPPSFYCTNDRTTCSSVKVRMSHMTEVVDEDTGMPARSWGAMWGWGVEWEDVNVFETVQYDGKDILQSLFSPIEIQNFYTVSLYSTKRYFLSLFKFIIQLKIFGLDFSYYMQCIK